MAHLQGHSPTGEKYHSIDLRPSDESEQAGIATFPQPDAYSSQTNLAGPNTSGATSYPPERHARFGQSQGSLSQRYGPPIPQPVAQMPIALGDGS